MAAELNCRPAMATSSAHANAGAAITGWFKRQPLQALALAAVVGILVYFFGWVPFFVNGRQSTLVWAWQAWNPETNYEHAKLIPLIVAFLVWHSRHKLKGATLASSNWGWLFIGLGIFLFLGGVRTIQARLAL